MDDNSLSLRRLLIWPLTLIGVIVWLTSSTIIRDSFVKNFEEISFRQAQSIAQTLSFLLDAITEEPEAITRAVESLAIDNEVDLILIAVETSDTLVSSNRRAWLDTPLDQLPDNRMSQMLRDTLTMNRLRKETHLLERDFLTYSFPIQVIDQTRPAKLINGAVAVRIDTAPLRTQYLSYQRHVGGLLSLLLIIIVSASYYLINHFVIGPLSRMNSAIQSQARSSATRAIPVIRNDEIGQLARSYNHLVGVLEQSKRQVEEQKERLEQLVKDLKQTNTELEEFTYIASHDLRSPLVNIKGFANELDLACESIRPVLDTIDSALSPDHREVLQMAFEEDIPEALHFISHSVERMDLYTQSILQLSRLGHKALAPKQLDTTRIVTTVLASYEHQLTEKEISTSIGHLPTIVADELSLSQIFGNLIDNAIKYSCPSHPCSLSVTGWEEDAYYYFSITDTGRGISEQYINKIFEIFRRGNHSDIEGHGMGLAFVRTLVRKHGGSITCSSVHGEGTQFTFSIHKRLEVSPEICSTTP